MFKSVVPSTRLFKSELSRSCILVVDFGDLITKIYQSPKTNNARGFSIAEGNTANTVLDSILEGGRINALVMEVESSSVPNIEADVSISDKLNLVLRFTSGQDELLTDVLSTRVKPG